MPTSQTMERNKINQNYEILTELFGYDCKKVKYYHKAVTRKNPFICFYKCYLENLSQGVLQFKLINGTRPRNPRRSILNNL